MSKRIISKNKVKCKIIKTNVLKEIKRILVFGDIHGDLSAIDFIRKSFNKKDDLLIFLGDYADRGEYGVEVIYAINNLIKKHPHRIIALKGNHEDYFPDGKPTFTPCSLIQEVNQKGLNWNKYFKTNFVPFVNKLYLSAILPNEILFVHGGICKAIKSVDDLINPTVYITKSILWNDPETLLEKRGNIKRGMKRGMFGESTTNAVCRNLNIKKIIRSHQPTLAPFKPLKQHKGKIITLNSTNIYGGLPYAIEFIVKAGFDTFNVIKICSQTKKYKRNVRQNK